MRRWMVLVPLGLAAAAAWLAGAPARAQEATPRELHFGAGSCAAQACHGGASAERQEYKVWATLDRHARAYDVLGGEVGRRIGQRLGIDPVSAPECLACHGTVGVRTADTFDPHDGVSCELCHGGAERWLGPHATPEWAAKTPAEKERFGLRDLSTPEKRAAACAQCHVAGPGRDITHAMMAAGHPPLAFELASFEAAMPPHWKDDAANPVFAWVEGAKAAAAARLGHLARAAKGEGWPEFAVFDCWSCHHEVYSGSVYEDAPPPGRPGDLAVDLASLEVLLVAAGDDALAKRFQRVVGLTHTPGTSARELADLAASAAAEVLRLLPEAKGYGRAEADRFLARLDAHLARVAGGGVRATRTEMEQIALAVRALVPDREAPEFARAWAEVDASLARPYDAKACAAAVRKAIPPP